MMALGFVSAEIKTMCYFGASESLLVVCQEVNRYIPVNAQ